MQNLGQMLAALPTACDVGCKKNSKGYKETWTGYKLHIDVACGQIPVSRALTSTSVHDSQVAIPLMTMTSARVSKSNHYPHQSPVDWPVWVQNLLGRPKARSSLAILRHSAQLPPRADELSEAAGVHI